jgi:hypothetical protein
MFLESYKSFADYTSAVTKSSHGNDNRHVSKAQRSGFRSRNLGADLDAYAGSIQDIRQSKLFRAGGLVFDAIFKDQARKIDRSHAFVSPLCDQHWTILWGVFAPDHSERLVAYAVLRRSGNLVRTLQIMGHGEFMRKGVMNLLIFDITRWLLEGQETVIQGVQYFLYGAVEHGGRGLCDWKRRHQFQPALILFSAQHPKMRRWDRARRWIAKGDAARDGKNWTAAARYYRKALKRNLKLAPIWVQYGHALKESGRIDDAEAAYRRSLAISPHVADAHLQLGHLQKVKGDLVAAVESYAAALRRDHGLVDAERELHALGRDAEIQKIRDEEVTLLSLADQIASHC